VDGIADKASPRAFVMPSTTVPKPPRIFGLLHRCSAWISLTPGYKTLQSRLGQNCLRGRNYCPVL
jgi:hypothetical protein